VLEKSLLLKISISKQKKILAKNLDSKVLNNFSLKLATPSIIKLKYSALSSLSFLTIIFRLAIISYQHVEYVVQERKESKKLDDSKEETIIFSIESQWEVILKFLVKKFCFFKGIILVRNFFMFPVKRKSHFKLLRVNFVKNGIP
jgi:hypothetical protein